MAKKTTTKTVSNTKKLTSKGGGGGRRDKDVLGNEIKPKVDYSRFNFATREELLARGFPEDWGSTGNGTVTKRSNPSTDRTITITKQSTPYTPGSKKR